MPERTILEAMNLRRVIGLAPSASVYDAACMMRRANCSSVLILEHGTNTMLGILTERDVMIRVVAKGLDPTKTMVSTVMTADPDSVRPETRVADAVLVMIERGFRHLPVVAASGTLLGVFSARDAMPREVDTAYGLSEFYEQVNDALG
jgi:CBS domain-containing protein